MTHESFFVRISIIRSDTYATVRDHDIRRAERDEDSNSGACETKHFSLTDANALYESLVMAQEAVCRTSRDTIALTVAAERSMRATMQDESAPETLAAKS